jgi:hypothetical protein
MSFSICFQRIAIVGRGTQAQQESPGIFQLLDQLEAVAENLLAECQ